MPYSRDKLSFSLIRPYYKANLFKLYSKHTYLTPGFAFIISNSIKQPYNNMKRIILLIIAAQQYCNVVDGALSTVVESGEEECFVVRAKSNSLIR